MRRSVLILTVCVLMQMAAASRADAALGWLDRLSGPGKWLTATLETRLKCFGAPGPAADATSTNGRAAATDANNQIDGQVTQSSQRDSDGGQGPGVRFAFCRAKDNDQRLFALEFGGTIGKTRDTQRTSDSLNFANGERIWLFDVLPMLSWRPIYHLQRARNPLDTGNHSLWDVVDVGAGVGPYWFTSSGLDSTVSGVHTELYAEAHVPPVLRSTGKPKIWRYLPSFRFSRIGFIGGFDPYAFGPRPIGAEHNVDDRVEWVNKYTFFYEFRIVR